MIQRLTTILVVALLLTCPYTCLGGTACCAGLAEAAPPACCEHCAPSSTGDQTQLPADEDPCVACCLCKGAVLPEAAPVVGTSDMLHFDLPTVECLSPALRTAIVREHDPASACPGDSLRIAIGSLTC